MTDSGHVRNMQNNLSNKFEKQCIWLAFILRIKIQVKYSFYVATCIRALVFQFCNTQLCVAQPAGTALSAHGTFMVMQKAEWKGE